CTIKPSEGRFSCAHGETCPPQQQCGADLVCHLHASFDASSGSSNTEAGTPISPGEIADTGVPPDAGHNPRATDADIATRDSGDETSCDPRCQAPNSICERGQCRECSAGSMRCDGDTPEHCDADNHWVVETTCGGSSPVCNAGVCGSVHLEGG